MQVVVAVPFEGFWWYADGAEAVDEPWDASWQGRTGPGQAKAEGVADSDFYGHVVVLGEFHQFCGEGQNEALEIGAGSVLEVTAWDNTVVEGGPDNVQVSIECLCPGFSELEEYVVVARGG